MKTSSKRSYFYFISLILMITTYLPLLFNNLPPLLGNHLLWTVIWFISLITMNPKVFKNKLLLYVVIYGVLFNLILLNTLWGDIDDWYKGQLTRETYQILVGVSVITYFRIENDFHRLAKLVKWSLLFIFITAVMTIITSILEPSYARSLTGLSAFTSQSEVDYISSLQKYGSGDYGYAIAIICLFPILIYFYRNQPTSILKKKYIFIFIIILFIALLRMQIFANILFSVFIITFSFTGSKSKKFISISAVFIVIILLIVPINFYAEILFSVAFWFPKDSEIYYKLNDMAKFIVFSDNLKSSLGIRANRYPLLIDAFLANPLLGYFVTERTKDISEGAHLYWMNKLAVYGLLGTIPFVYIIYNYIKDSLRYFKKEYEFYFLLSFFSVIALGFLKALSQKEMWYMLLIIIPGLYYLPLLKKNKKSKNYKLFDKSN